MSMTLAQFQADCARLSEVLGLKGHMVGVSFVNEVPETPKPAKPVVACQAIQDARFGKTVILGRDNSKCLGATYFLGFEPLSPLAFDFWVRNEQSLYSREAAETMISALPSPPLGRSHYVQFTPVADARDVPELILIVANAGQISRLLGLATFRTGRPATLFGYGATCQIAIGVPIVTDDIQVSFVDVASRHIAGFSENEQVISIPYAQMEEICRNVAESINGTANPPFNRQGLHYLQGVWTVPDSM